MNRLPKGKISRDDINLLVEGVCNDVGSIRVRGENIDPALLLVNSVGNRDSRERRREFALTLLCDHLTTVNPLDKGAVPALKVLKELDVSDKELEEQFSGRDLPTIKEALRKVDLARPAIEKTLARLKRGEGVAFGSHLPGGFAKSMRR